MSESLNDIIDVPAPRGWGVQPSEPAQGTQPESADAGTEHPETDSTGMEQEPTLESDGADELGLSPEELETTAYKKLNKTLSQRGQENKELREQLARLAGQVETLTRTAAPQQETPSEEARDVYDLQFDDTYVPELSEDASLYGSEAEIAQITRAIVQREIRAAVRQVTAQSEAQVQQQQVAEREQRAGGVIAEWAEKAKADPHFDKDAIGAIAKQTGNLYLEAPDMFLDLVEKRLGISTTPVAAKPATTQPAPSVTRPVSNTPRHNRPGTGVRPIGRMSISDGVDAAMKDLGFG